MAGMDPLVFLHERDAWTRNLMQAVAAAVSELETRRDRNRANLIATAVGKMLQESMKKK